MKRYGNLYDKICEMSNLELAFAKEDTRLDGDKIKISELFNREIIVLGYRKFDSKAVEGKECVQLQIELDGKKMVTFTNSAVIARQLEQYAEYLPFETVIKKVHSYYTFS